MSIRAIFKEGKIQPLQEIPSDWTEGQELLIEQLGEPVSEQEIQQWLQQMEAGAAQISAKDEEVFLRAIEEHRKESKEAVAREWGLL